MESSASRLNSFKKSKRVKNPEKPSSTVTLKWPHPSDFKATPETLAEAGFYYDPAFDDPDNVTCYMCDKELAGWEEDDDPFLLHWVKCGQRCSWASLRCGLTVDVDQSGRFISTDKTRNPAHKSMEKARLETFSAGKGWIHDHSKSHGANSTMMARAGFVYAPQESGDDLATCLYCGVSLRGWEPEDDPMAEHRKRAAKSDTPCAFFIALEPPRAQSTKPSSKAQNKPASKASSKSRTQDVATKTDDGEDDEDDFSEVVKVKPASKTRKPRSTSSSIASKPASKVTKTKSRSASRSALKDVAEEEEDEEDQEVVSEVEEPKKSVKKKAPSRSKSTIKSVVEDVEEDTPAQPPPTVKKKSHSKSKSVQKIENDVVEEKVQQVSSTKKVKPNSRSTAKLVVEVESENEGSEGKSSRKTRNAPTHESEQENAEEVLRKSSRSKSKAPTAPITAAASRKASRSKSKSSLMPSEMAEEPKQRPPRSKGKAKAQETDIVEDFDEVVQKPSSKTKHRKTASKSKVKGPIALSETESSEQYESAVEVVQPKKVPVPAKPPRPHGKGRVTNEDVPMESVDTHDLPQSRISPEPTSTTDLPPLFIPKRTAAPPAHSLLSSPPSTKLPPPLKPNAPPLNTRKVVEISTDEESEGDDATYVRQDDIRPVESTTHETRRPSSPRISRKKSITVETVRPVKQTSPDTAPGTEAVSDADFNMNFANPDSDHQMEDVLMLSTPPRSKAQPTYSVQLSDNEAKQSMPESSSLGSQSSAPTVPAPPPFMPPLSKLPFTPLQSLTDAELDMTVEEWIRYQMDVEYDKFRRDGERELQQFRKRAEEVRKTIEGL